MDRERVIDVLFPAKRHVQHVSPGMQTRIMSEHYQQGDLIIAGLMFIHFLIACGLSWVYDTWSLGVGGGGVALFAFMFCARFRPGTYLTRCMAGMSFMAFAAIHVSQMRGMPEMNFFYFTAFCMMVVYQDWRCFWPAALLAIFQHSIFFLLVSRGVAAFSLWAPDERYGGLRLGFHMAILVVEVALCAYWAEYFRQKTIRGAIQRAEIEESRRIIQLELKQTEAHVDELHRDRRQLQRDAVESNLRAAQAMEQLEKVEQSRQELQELKSNLEARNAELKDLSDRDGLTGLYNHRSFQNSLTDLLRKGKSFSLILLDLDRFKQLNDNFGHLRGDWVLRETAKVMTQTCDSDCVICRYGGEEFAILVPSSSPRQAMKIADTVRANIEAHDFSGIDVTASLGVAFNRNAGMTADEVVHIADTGLYQAKRQGRNQVVIVGQNDLISAAS